MSSESHGSYITNSIGPALRVPSGDADTDPAPAPKGLNLSQHRSTLALSASPIEQESQMTWTSKGRGWWEAQGVAYTYRAVQRSSRSWDLMVFGQGLEATADYPVTLSDCKYYAAQVESGKYQVRHGRLVKT